MTQQDAQLSENVSSGRIQRFIGPCVIAIAAFIMACWSWGTWTDPLVDFGAQLYVPWQLAKSHVLYRDVAYYNGPLSSYLNALAFGVFGIGISTIVHLNFLILAAAMILSYRLTAAASGRLSAMMGGLTFTLIFAFGHVVNYNWITPYTHEITHGIVLGLAAMTCVDRYQRTGRVHWLAIGGGALGLVFLTKAEPTAACFAAVGTQLLGGWWFLRTNPRRALRELMIVIATALIAPLLAWIFLSTAMPAPRAVRGAGVMAMGSGSPNHVAALLSRYRGAGRHHGQPSPDTELVSGICDFAGVGGGIGVFVPSETHAVARRAPGVFCFCIFDWLEFCRDQLDRYAHTAAGLHVVGRPLHRRCVVPAIECRVAASTGVGGLCRRISAQAGVSRLRVSLWICTGVAGDGGFGLRGYTTSTPMGRSARRCRRSGAHGWIGSLVRCHAGDADAEGGAAQSSVNNHRRWNQRRVPRRSPRG